MNGDKTADWETPYRVVKVENTESVEMDLDSTHNKKERKLNDVHGARSCDQCDYKGSKNGLRRHKKRFHREHKISEYKEIVRACDQCDYTALTLSELNDHILFEHQNHSSDVQEGVNHNKTLLNNHTGTIHGERKWPCDQCEFTVTTLKELNEHILSVHQGIKYPCDQCDYEGSKTALFKHKRSKHIERNWPCDQCDYVDTSLKALNAHIISEHQKRKLDVQGAVQLIFAERQKRVKYVNETIIKSELITEQDPLSDTLCLIEETGLEHVKKEEITEEEDPLADTCTTGTIDKETSIQDPFGEYCSEERK